MKRAKKPIEAAIVKIPQRLIIVKFPRTVVFPGIPILLETDDPAVASLAPGSNCIISFVFSEIEATHPPSIGMLSFVAGVNKNQSGEAPGGIMYTAAIMGLRRVRIQNIRPKGGVSGKEVSDCEWSELESQEFPLTAWENPENQEARRFVKESFGYIVIEMRNMLADQIQFSNKFVTNQKTREERNGLLGTSIRRLLALDKEFANADRMKFDGVLDRVVGAATDFLLIICNDRLSPEVFLLMRWIFLSENPEERLSRTYELFTEITVAMEAEKSGGQSANDNDLPDYVKEEIAKLLPRARGNSQEAIVNQTYIEYVESMPWNKITVDEEDFPTVRKRLEEDHEGLELVKERILQFLAGHSGQKAAGRILCFVGPPGVGKTSMGKSIALALGRKFVRISLAGLKDEAELRGHRRTYVGALAGKIAEGLRKAESGNPVFMLDEVEKIGEHGGDKPVNALNEILDPEQNNAFVDNYLGINLPIDLSRVFFIATANTLETIPDSLLSRMEVIEIPGYTEEQKVRIAEKHLVGKLKRELGIDSNNWQQKKLPVFDLDFTRKALQTIVEDYTDDAGVRDTERNMRTVIERFLLELREGKRKLESTNGNGEENGRGFAEPHESQPPADAKTANIIKKALNPADVRRYLEEPVHRNNLPDLANPKIGVGFYLAVDTNGQGGVGRVEASMREDDRFDIKATGLLGATMVETLDVVVSRLIHRGGILEGMSHKFFNHVHYGRGSIHKDGPSAGVITYLAEFSCFIGRPMKPYLAATGEMTKQCDLVDEVGGIQIKLLAARKAGILEVIIPFANISDLKQFPTEGVRVITPDDLTREEKPWKDFSRKTKERESFTIYCIEKPDDALEIAFPDYFPLPEELRAELMNREKKE